MLGDTEAHVATTDLESEYEILGELGRGATAVVYRARDRELGREVAIKVIRPKFADDDETVARLAREARTVAQLQHPNIVTLYAVRRVRDGSLALVMQLVPGRTLRELLNERGACTFERVDRVLRDVGAALAHAHKRGIVHRDVKPENIFIDEGTGQALLSDFGVARSLEPDSQLTATGTAIGTPAYMSPEQIDGTALDGRSDLYSLGLVGWEMLTGRRPWEGESLYSVIYKQKREELPPVDELRPDTPHRLVYLVEGATRKQPEERWASAAEMLDKALTITPEGGWARWQSERRKRRRAVIYAAARDRGDSIVSAAIETVRFRRDGAPIRALTDQSTQAATVAHSPDAVAPVPVPVPDNPLDEPETRRRGSVVPAFVITLVVVAAIAASLRFMRGGAEPVASVNPPTTFSDNGGVEVPLGKGTLPNAGTGVGSRTRDTTVLATSTPPAEPRDSARATATAAESTRDDPAAAHPPAAITPDRTPPGQAASTSRAASGGEVNRQTSTDRVAIATPTPSVQPPPSVATRATSPGTRPGAPDSAVPTVSSPSPAVTGVAFPAERGIIAAGGRHSCALESNGSAVCWGANDQGQLGDGSRDDHTSPTVVAGDLTFSQLSAGSSHTCAVTRDGDAYCWGNNERGQLGDATSLERDTPVRVSGAGPFKAVRAGFSHTCALARTGEVYCWGSNAYGQLGSGVGLSNARPGVVSGALAFGALAVGWNHSCGITVGGDLYCWGSNNTGQLGDGTRDDRRVPTRVASTSRFVSVAAGTQHTCAVTTVGEVYCWGRNNYGQLATGTGDQSQPTRVDVSGDFASVTAGAVHTCARTRTGQVSCWGRNTFGQLGDGTTVDRPSPVRVVGIPTVAVVQATGAHTCAATSAGESYCWGYNVEGQLGDGTRNHRSRPVRVATQPR